MRVALVLCLSTAIFVSKTTHAAFYSCLAPCEAMLLPRDMDNMQQCYCPGEAQGENTHDSHISRHYICPGGSSANSLNPKSFSDCDCLPGYTRFDSMRLCNPSDTFTCTSPYIPKEGLNGHPTSLDDCACEPPYVKTNDTNICELHMCPRAGNYKVKANVDIVKSLVDCDCIPPFIKHAQTGECLLPQGLRCPLHAHSKHLNGKIQTINDCECESGYIMSDDGSCHVETSTYDCPSNAYKKESLGRDAEPRSFEECECSAGYIRNDRAEVCEDSSTSSSPSYTCPPHSSAHNAKSTPTSFGDCDCVRGYYRNEDEKSCDAWPLGNDVCPPYSLLSQWPVEGDSSCKCVFGQQEDNEASCQSHPSINTDDKTWEEGCPAHAMAVNWPVVSSQDCFCAFGYEDSHHAKHIQANDTSASGESKVLKCVQSDTINVEERKERCQLPMQFDTTDGACRLRMEEVQPMKSNSSGSIIHRGIEYDYILADENRMIIQGDIAIGDVVVRTLEDGSTVSKQVLHGYFNDHIDHRWEEGRMCFQIEDSAHSFQQTIVKAIDHIALTTGFSFFRCPKDTCESEAFCSKGFVSFHQTPSSCYSYIGRVGGKQPIGVSADCGEGNLMHVILHAIGLHHPHNRDDRDDHIHVAWECLPMDKRSNFIKDEGTRHAENNMAYDYYSIMHAPSDAFIPRQHAKIVDNTSEASIPDWCESLIPTLHDRNQRHLVMEVMGQRSFLSLGDIHAVYDLYPFLRQHKSHTTNVHVSSIHKPVEVHPFWSRTPHLHISDSSVMKKTATFLGSMATLAGFAGLILFASIYVRRNHNTTPRHPVFGEALLPARHY